jgi:smad nuclear-interacting protein 1
MNDKRDKKRAFPDENKKESSDHNGTNTNNSEQQQWGKNAEIVDENTEVVVKKFKPNFDLTGALAKDEVTGNTINGVVMKWTEPQDSATPDKKWRFYVFKEEKVVDTLHIHRKSVFLAGRDTRVADLSLAHPSCSKQHAVIQFRKVEKIRKDGTSFELILPYIMDLASVHKTFVNGEAIEDSRYYELRAKDCVKFGASTREYVLMVDEESN